MEPDAQQASVLRGLPLSATVREALDNAAGSCEAGRPLQTGMVLAALIEADAHGDWEGVWPSYDGAAEAVLASDDDANALASDERWRQADLSEDLLAALDLLAETARRHAMDPIQPGALALALASIQGSSASRHLSRLSGYSSAELIRLIQSDLLGTILEGFGDTARPEAGPPPPRPTALLSAAGLLAAAACVIGAWQALRLIAGPLGGAALTLIVFLALLSTMRKSSGTRRSGAEQTEIRSWNLANYLDPLKLLALLAGVSFLIYILVNKHRLGPAYPIGVTADAFLLAFTVFIGSTSAGWRPGRSSRARRYTWFPASTRYHRLPAVCGLITGLVVAIAAGAAQLTFEHSSPYPGGLLISKWTRATVFDSALSGWLPLWCWTVLVALAAAAGGYLMGAAVWAASKARQAATARSWRWHAIAACLVGAAVTLLGNLPQSPLNYPAIASPFFTAPRRFPTYPDAITLNDAISFTSLRWTYVSPTKAVADGYIGVDECSPSCAAGTLQEIPVDVTFLAPRQCTVESAYVHVTMYVFTQVQIRPIFNDLPGYVAEHYIIIGACR